MDRERFRFVLLSTISMAHDYSLETRIRRLIYAHWEAGDTPRTLVMNRDTWRGLITETTGYKDGYYWAATQGDGSTFMGVPILLKDFMPDLEVVVGV